MFNFDAYWDPIDLEELMRTVQHALKKKIDDEKHHQNIYDDTYRAEGEKDNIVFSSNSVFIPKNEIDPDPNIIDHILDMLEDALNNDDMFLDPLFDEDLEFEPIKTTHIFYKGKLLTCDVIDEAYCLYPYEQWSDLEFIN